MADGAARTSLVALGGAWRPPAAQARLLMGLTERAARAHSSPDDLLAHAARELARVLDDSCIAALLSHDGRWLRPRAAVHPHADADHADADFVGKDLRADCGFTWRVCTTRRALRVPSTSPEVLRAVRPQIGAFAEQCAVRSLIVAPMRAAGRLVGILTVMRAGSRPPHSAADEAFAQAVADLLGLGVQASYAAPPVARCASEPPRELTEREQQVLALLAQGHTNREIAQELVLSVRTVEWHRTRIRSKLGVSGRAALVAEARARDLIDGMRPAP